MPLSALASNVGLSVGLDAAVQGDNAAGHIVVTDTGKAGSFHHGLQGFLVGCMRMDSAR